MNAITLATLLLVPTTPSSDLIDGSIVVLEYSNKPVSRYTKSSITHVAVLRLIAGSPWVYEATPNQVRCVPWSSYGKEITELNRTRKQQTRLWIMSPSKPYSEDQLARMDRFLKNQKGRRYSIKGYVRGAPAEGIHCAEFVSRALSSTGRYRFKNSHALGPAVLVRHVVKGHQRPIEFPLKAAVAEESWCDRAWQDWFAFQKWCAWAALEAWLFYR